MSSTSESESSDSECGKPGDSKRRHTVQRFSLHLTLEDEVDREEQLRSEEKHLVESGNDQLRIFLFEFTEHKVFSIAILLVIFVNTIFIGLQTSEEIMAKSGWYLGIVDNIFLAIYIMELVLKLYVWRLRYFKIGWNVFDCLIVVASFVDFLIPLIVQNFGAFDTKVFRVLKVFRAIRALKALRVLRTIRFLKNLQIIVATVLRSIPAMGNIVLLISLVLYVFAVIGRGLYAEVDPGRFGNLGVACYTLFQLLTLDDWYFMYLDVAKKHPDHKHIFIYLLLFIVLETFICINLFVAVIVDNLEQTQAAASSSKSKKKTFGHKNHHDQDSDTDVTGDNTLKGKKYSDAGRTNSAAIEEYYSPEQYSERERELRVQYFSILSSLEYHLHIRRQHHQTMEELIDLVDFVKN